MAGFEKKGEGCGEAAAGADEVHPEAPRPLLRGAGRHGEAHGGLRPAPRAAGGAAEEEGEGASCFGGELEAAGLGGKGCAGVRREVGEDDGGEGGDAEGLFEGPEAVGGRSGTEEEHGAGGGGPRKQGGRVEIAGGVDEGHGRRGPGPLGEDALMPEGDGAHELEGPGALRGGDDLGERAARDPAAGEGSVERIDAGGRHGTQGGVAESAVEGADAGAQVLQDVGVSGSGRCHGGVGSGAGPPERGEMTTMAAMATKSPVTPSGPGAGSGSQS